MGFFSKVWKGIKTSFIGKAVRSVVKRFGKFMDKIGVVGQIAMSLMLPGVGELMGMLSNAMVNYSGFASTIVNGAGKFLQVATNVGTKMMKPFKTLTKGVTDVFKNTLGGVAEALNIDGALNKLTGRMPDPITGAAHPKAFNFEKYAFGSKKLTGDIQKMFTGLKHDFVGQTGLIGDKGLFTSDTFTATYGERQAQEAAMQKAISGGLEGVVEQAGSQYKVPDISEAMKIPGSPDLTVKNLEGKFADIGLKDLNISAEQFDAGQSFIDNMAAQSGGTQGLMKDFTLNKMEADGFFDKTYDMTDMDKLLPKTVEMPDVKSYDSLLDATRDVKDLSTVGERAIDTLNLDAAPSATASSLMGEKQPGFFKSVTDYAGTAVGEVTDTLKDPSKFGSYLVSKGDEFVSMAVGSAASGLMNKAIYGDPEVGNAYSSNVVLPQLPLAESFGAVQNTTASAADYLYNIQQGNNYGANSIWYDWQQWAEDFRASPAYQQNVAGVSQ